MAHRPERALVLRVGALKAAFAKMHDANRMLARDELRGAIMDGLIDEPGHLELTTNIVLDWRYAESLFGRDLGCNDVFIVMGYTSIFSPTRGDQYFPSMPFGLGRAPRPAWPPAPSFANPVALAHFVRVADDHPAATTDAWLDLLTDGWSQPILDPLLYASFPSEP